MIALAQVVAVIGIIWFGSRLLEPLLLCIALWSRDAELFIDQVLASMSPEEVEAIMAPVKIGDKEYVPTKADIVKYMRLGETAKVIGYLAVIAAAIVLLALAY